MYPPKKLTRFERARIIGARALQISLGAPVLVDVPPDMTTPIEIALYELKKGVIPITVIRKHPSGKIEIVDLKNKL
ncbi:MAG: DNA-directed RNA polymerase subunit K [Euryarchaeota archaeon]|nr:DNA-directed RNA polymerase subunit K [Euryarchaeota archaeon]